MTAANETNQALVEQLPRLDAARMRGYRENLAFYQGQQWPGNGRRRDRRLVFNYAKTLVDKAASYLMGGVSFVVDEDDASEESKQRARRSERALRDVYEANSLAQLDFDSEVDAAVLGDGVYKVTWDPDERRVRVSAPDVQGIHAWWLGDDVSRIWRVASRYRLSEEEAALLYGGDVAYGHTRIRASGTAPSGRKQHAVTELWTAERFELWLDGTLVEAKANPYGFIPFVIYANLREPKQFWGVSDIGAVTEPVRELNRALSQLSMILELSGNPIAVLENVTESQDIAVQPGAVWELPERARAYLLDLLQGGGVRLHVEYVDLIYRTLHDLGETPRTAFGSGNAALSGVALNIELDPLLKKVQRKRLLREVAFRQRNEMILRLLEQYTGVSYAPYRSRVVWGELLPVDRSRLVSDEARLVASGIHSRRTAADELGVADPESEFERWREEATALRGEAATAGDGA
ncbi:MAG TPA: phage portal protein [Dehalococcoidia bacterium]|nr:phage portal protein [Dehalococcoidia bacterium]